VAGPPLAARALLLLLLLLLLRVHGCRVRGSAFFLGGGL
jgi:hypothetical protein